MSQEEALELVQDTSLVADLDIAQPSGKDDGFGVSGESSFSASCPVSAAGKAKPQSVLPLLLRRARPGLTANLRGLRGSDNEDEVQPIGSSGPSASPTVTRSTQGFPQAPPTLTQERQSLIMRAKVTGRRDSTIDTDWYAAPLFTIPATTSVQSTVTIFPFNRASSLGEMQFPASPSQAQPQQPQQLQSHPSQFLPQPPQSPQSPPRAQSGTPQPRARRPQPLVPSNSPGISVRSLAASAERPDAPYGSRSAPIDGYVVGGNGAGGGGSGSRSSTPTSRTFVTPLQLQLQQRASQLAGTIADPRVAPTTPPLGSLATPSMTAAAATTTAATATTTVAATTTTTAAAAGTGTAAAAAATATPSSPVSPGGVNSVSVVRLSGGGGRCSIALPLPLPSVPSSMFRTTFIPHMDADIAGLDGNQGFQPGHTTTSHDSQLPAPFQGLMTQMRASASFPPAPTPTAVRVSLCGPRVSRCGSGNTTTSTGGSGLARGPKDAAPSAAGTLLGTAASQGGSDRCRSLPLPLLTLTPPSGQASSLRPSNTAIQVLDVDDTGPVRRISSATTAVQNSTVVPRRSATPTTPRTAAAAAAGWREGSGYGDGCLSPGGGGGGGGRGGSGGSEPAGGGGGECETGDAGSGVSTPAGVSGELVKRGSAGSPIGQLLRDFTGEGPMGSAARQLAALQRAKDKAQVGRKGSLVNAGSEPLWRPRLTSRSVAMA